MIVDFAPHALEFLRDDHAHLRLGFSDRQIADWFAEAGLDLEESQEFEPRGGSRGAADGQAVARPRPPPADRRTHPRWRKGDSLMNQPRFSRRPDIGDKISVSFEFFPPKTDEMEARLWDTVTRLEPLEPRIRFGDLWRGRLDARTHGAHRQAHPDRLDADAAAHLTCVDATKRRDRPGDRANSLTWA